MTPITPGKKIRLVYILSASHSGSTLLSMLLGAHPEICTVGELKATALDDSERYLCSCRQIIKNCPFWNAISQDMAAKGICFDITKAVTDYATGANRYIRRILRPLHRGFFWEKIRDSALAVSPLWRANLKNIQLLNTALMECILARTGKKVILDSSKIGIRLKYLLKNPFLDVSVVRLVRDGRGVALTYTDPARYADAQDARLRGGGTGGTRSGEKVPLLKAAMEWRRSNEEAEAILEGLAHSRWFKVYYENLCIQKNDVLKRLFDFIGVDSDVKICNYRSVDHHILGNGMRLDVSNTVQLDERWKSILTASDLQAFNKIAGRMNRSLGYH